MKKLCLVFIFCSSSISCMDYTDPLADGKSRLQLINVGGDDLSVINAARISYNREIRSQDQVNYSLIDRLIKNKHTTPFEQTFLQYKVVAPIFVVRQWMRHRIGVSYNEQSARYTELNYGYYIPRHIKDDEQFCRDYTTAIDFSYRIYTSLLMANVPQEEARAVLPVSMYTKFYFSCNLASLFHFAQLRSSSHAQWEIQQYAKSLLSLASSQFPYSIKAWCTENKVDTPFLF